MLTKQKAYFKKVAKRRSYAPSKFLRDSYKHFNRLYFKGKLPQDLTIGWASDRTLGGDMGWAFGNNILINKRLTEWSLVALQTVLHEMCHISKPSDDGHGKQFTKELKRLIRAGAFDPLL